MSDQNHNNSSTTTTTAPTNSASIILAANYVPQHAIQWKELPASITLACRSLDTNNNNNNNNDINNNNHMNSELMNNTIHMQHLTEYNYHIGNNNSSTSIPLSWPNAIHEFNDEFRYAIEAKKHRNWLLQQKRSMSTTTSTTVVPLNMKGMSISSHQYHKQLSSLSTSLISLTLPNVRDIPENDIMTYVQTFQTLLQTERYEILMKYDDYTQYEQLINVGEPLISQRSSKPMTSNNQNQINNDEIYFLTACIPGIADSKPLPQRGDWLMLRPISYISMPIMSNNNNNKTNSNTNNPHPTSTTPTNTSTNGTSNNNNNNNDTIVGWTPACHVVDIRATITNVSRSNDGSDVITSTWLVPQQDAILRSTYGIKLPYQIRIIPNKKDYERCMIALLWLKTLSLTNIMDPILFPINAPELYIPPYQPTISSISSLSTPSSILQNQFINYHKMSELNTQQISFIRILLARTNQPSYDEIRSPVILTGPAGTGKTKTLLYAILEILNQNPQSQSPNNYHDTNNNTTVTINMNRILICTPSHTAANVITQRLAKDLKPNELFRLLDTDRNVVTIPINILSYCYQNHNTGSFDIPTIKQLLNYRVIVSTCIDTSILYRIGFTNQQLHNKRIQYKNYINEICTSYNINVSFNNNSVEAPHFTHFFMDEAAQATEPESLIPLSVVVDPTVRDESSNTGTQKVEIALVGDPRQLSPSVYSKDAANAGLSYSWIERLLRRPVSCLQGTTTTTTDTTTTTNTTTNNDKSRDVPIVSHQKNSKELNGISTQNDDDDMLGPELVQMDQWIRYSMEQDGHEHLSMFLMLNYRGHPSFLMIPSSLFYSDRLQKAHVLAEEEESIKLETYWCQQLRIVEALAQPVTLESHQLTSNQQQQQQQQLDSNIDASKSNNSSNKNKKKKKKNGNKNGNNDNTVKPPEFIQYKQWNWPIHFRGVVGNDKNTSIQSQFSTDSWCNEEEANAVYEIVKELTSNGVSTGSIGVIAPFRGQVVLIRKLLRSKGLGGIDVGTIEDYQSAERDVIIFSLTRSSKAFIQHDNEHRIGIFGTQQAKRCNVALTRARYLFIVIGNPRIMIEDFLWRQFLWFCYRNVLWYGESDGMVPLFSWNNELKIVNTFDILKENYHPNNDDTASSPQQTSNNSNSSIKTIYDDMNTIVISTLERTIRQVK